MIGLHDHRRWPIVDQPQRDAVLRVLARGVLSGSNAPEAVAFEREFADFVGARHALLTHSGTSALHLALVAAGVRAGDHVVVPAYSFVATPLAVLHAGAIPIFADVDEQTGLVTAETVSTALTSRTRAVMPVHVHGCAADMSALADVAKRHRLILVEDAAQAHGATWRGKPVGALGAAGGFSLQSSKNLGVGEGGVFVTNDDAALELANRIRNFGQDVTIGDRATFDPEHPLDAGRSLRSSAVGGMYRGNELSAALARVGLAGLADRTSACQANAARLSHALSELPGVEPPRVPEGATSVHHKFRVRVDPERAGVDLAPRAFRDLVMRALAAEGLEVVLWQTEPLPDHPVFGARAGLGRGFPWSLDPETDFATLYDGQRFEGTRRLLDGSFLLFSQSYPLIAQDASLVDRYAEAFARVFGARHELARRAARGEAGDCP